MRLSKLKLMNYRCFGSEEQVILIDNLTTFIGNNSAGKTAALSALNCMFSENSGDRILQRSDFHLPKEMAPDEMESQNLYIEAVFEFEELQSEAGGGEYAIPIFFQHLVVDNPGGLPYLRIRLEATWEKSSTIDGSIDSKINYIICPESVEIEDVHRTNAARRDLDKIRVVYVPAVRDPSRQLKNASGTMMYQVMSSINWSEETKGNVKAKIKELNEQFEGEKGVSMFGMSLAKQWKAYDSDDRYSTASLRFNSTDIETSIRKTEVVFEPTETGKEYTIDQMGDGLRSLFYISLVDSVLDVEGQMQREIEADPENTSFSRKPPILTIVALEEPENHIAPHLLGKLVGNLRNIAGKHNAQAIMTSHSPAIVKRVDPENLRYFRMDKDLLASKVRSITLPEKESAQDQYKYIKEAVRAYPELYFAKLVILGEGDSEEIILPKYWEAVNGSVDVGGISIVPLGGRHVNHFWRLLNDLQIPHITLLDLDREREGGGWGRIKYVLKQLIANGYDRNILLNTSDGVLTDKEFEEMSEWDIADEEWMQGWIDFLEDYNIFFSAPLDMDFMMLEQMEAEYKASLDMAEGPRLEVTVDEEKKRILIQTIEGTGDYRTEYETRIKKDIKSTLKEEGGDGRTYSAEQQKLMVWYTYFFLNRGKPSTHIAVLSRLSDEAIKANIPPVLKRLIETAERILKGDQK
ncbi:MAG: AAA family ATPase [Bacteroidaceae bacterium]|nr:AAA family ATPase [Bacteroidaceae bacterium]